MKWLVKLYPPLWRRRYESELLALLDEERASLGLGLDLVHGALDAWLTGPRLARPALVFWGAVLAYAVTTGVWVFAKRALGVNDELDTLLQVLYWLLYILFVDWLFRQRGVTCDLTRFRRHPK